MTRVLAVCAVALLLVAALVGLRRWTMTVHTPMPPDSQLVVEATARWKGSAIAAANRARALSYACVAESSDRATVQEFTWHRDGEFDLHVVPTLDAADQRQLDGCLSDVRIPRLLVTVARMRSTGSGDGHR